jgi:hypothetical protein
LQTSGTALLLPIADERENSVAGQKDSCWRLAMGKRISSIPIPMRAARHTRPDFSLDRGSFLAFGG